ncbi:MAG: cytochrome c oxidase accessory protein CcoG [Sutterellaceae bacterium]|nr:cytochrome c oxidase accessory protein CcoG [Burkholderiaceae bacterium]MDW8429557.1 cytochrome c oxidase accessory protein CcoG [Sutterellaceae bacterium]
MNAALREKEAPPTPSPAVPPPTAAPPPANAAAGGKEIVEEFYVKRVEIYPRAKVGDSLGFFQKWRWAMVWATQIVFYGLPWLTWNGRQAVLFDLVQRKFYIFGLILWPQDIVFLTGILIISALSLFLFTAIGGRLWCGYTCPQTVYTEIFMWIERRIEGDRAKRMALDRAPWSARKLALKSAKHAAWVAVALWTGFTFVGYFTPIRELAGSVASFATGPWETFWILFYGFATYGNAGWLREQVCKYMCPYARFQSAMFDSDTLIVTYDAQRGEPRGTGLRNRRERGLGDCVDCGLCVQVCPTGIDIRNGLQYECIGCAACIDACNYVMDKAGLPRGLIRYATANSLRGHYGRAIIVRRIFRPRVLVYGAMLLALVTALVTAIVLRVPLKVDVIRDRGALAREVYDERGAPWVENVYRLQVMNTSETARTYEVRVSGLPDLTVASEPRFAVPATTTQSVPLRLQAPAQAVAPGAHPVQVEIVAVDDAAVRVREKTTFLGLRR